MSDLLAGDASFALLAAGGVGKTVTLRALAASELAEVCDAGLLTRAELRLHLQEIVRRGGPGYLDGLDQAAAYDARLLPWLETILVTDEARQVRWRLGCRSAAWDSALSGALARELPGFEVWKLLPLDRAAAVELLSGVGLDGEFFVDELVRARLGRLSACVTRLLAAARYWSDHGALPRGGVVQAIDYEVPGLLQEWDTRRRPAWPQDRGLRVAKRLAAAFTMFSGRTTLTSEPGGGSATLSVVDLPSDAEPSEPDRPIEPADYSNVLGTPLFDPAHSACVAFRHQIYQEYLAAAYLIDRFMVREQVNALLGVSPAGVLPTTRIGVAAWLATLRLELVEPLIEQNASKFAESVVAELPADGARSAVVAGLLRAAAVDEQRPDWRVDLAGLNHEGLEEQLVAQLEEVASTEQLWWIARLALACSCTRTVPRLLAEAHNRTWFGYGRRAAAVAVTKLGDDAQRRALLGILGEGDEDGELLAAVIDGLYPRLMTTVELTSVLRPAPKDFLGAYRMTLKGLVDRIPNEDLAGFTRWFSAEIRDHGQPRDFEDLLSRLVKRMWETVDDPEVRAALAELLHRSERAGYWYSHEHGAEAPWKDGDDADRRRELAIDLAILGHEDSGYAVVTLGLLTPADLTWLLDQVTQPGPAQQPLLRCVPYLVGSPASAAAADAVLGMDPSHPAYAVTSGWRGSSRLDDPQNASRRERIARQREYEHQVADHDDRCRVALHDAIARLEDDPASWWRVAELLAVEDNHSEEVFNHDLTARTRWTTLPPDQQEAILNAGVRYVRSHRPQADAWCTADQVTHSQVLPDWAGVHLMATLAHHRPATLTSLDDTTWIRWAHSIIATWHLTEPTSGARLDLIDIAMAADSDALVEAALTHLDHLQQAGKALTSHQIYQRVVAAAPARFAAALISGRYQQKLGESLLQIVARNGNSAGLDMCHRIARDIEHPLRLQAWVQLAVLEPNAIVDHLVSLPVHDTETLTVVGSLDIGGLDIDHLERVAQFLLDRCPPHADPPIRPGWRFSDDSPPQVIRGRALDQLAILGHVEALERFKIGRPAVDQRVIANYLQSARTRQADLAVPTVEPASLLQLLRRADARLIRHDSDLQQVVLTQLGQLQHDIQHRGAYREIWRDGRPQSEDDISDWIRRRFEERITRGLLIDREPQVKRIANRGVGTRVDLIATATTTSRDVARIVIEAKHHSNRELRTAMREQLVERYLAPMGRRHGIYLVYWTALEQRLAGMSRSTSPDVRDLQRALTDQAEQLREAGWAVTPFVLDISKPQAR